jgi:cell division topological specificity factor
MIDFLNKLFGRQTSGATAKERLRLVLMSDHLSLAPEMVESMKRDLIEVISRYVQVDRAKIDVHFENQDNALAMLANIPITGVNRGGGDGGSKSEEPEEAQPVAADAAVASTEVPSATASAPSAQPKPQNGGGSRKKRKKSGGSGHQTSGTPAPAT